MKFILLGLMVCTLSSCISVSMDDDTKHRMDAATLEIKRLNDQMSKFEKDVQALTEALNKLTAFRNGRKEN